MGHQHLRPELAHATGHRIGIALQVTARFQSDNELSILLMENGQVSNHPVGKGHQEAAYLLPIAISQSIVASKAVAEIVQKNDLAGCGIRGPATLFEILEEAAVFSLQPEPKMIQSRQAAGNPLSPEHLRALVRGAMDMTDIRYIERNLK